MWWSKHLATIEQSRRPIAVVGEPHWGGGYLVAQLGSSKRPTVHITLDASDQGNGVAQGNKLSDAVATCFNAPLFGYGRRSTYGAKVLERHAALLGPFSIAVTGAEHGQDLVESLLPLHGPHIGIVLWYQRDPGKVLKQAALVIGPKELALSREEARLLVPTGISEDIFLQAFAASRGAIGSFLDEIHKNMGLPPFTASWAPEDDGSDLEPRMLIEVAQREGNWLRVLEITGAHFPERVPEIVNLGGDYAYERGLFQDLWDSLDSLPPVVSDDPKVMYWRFATAIALNCYREMIPQVRNYLKTSNAPEVRSLLAMAFPSSASLQEAEQAVQEHRSPVTLRSLGFCKSLFEGPREAVPFIKESMELAELENRRHLVIGAADDMSSTSIRMGEYRKTVAWSRWALNRFGREGLQEELLRLRLVNSFVYSSLLVGNLATATREIAKHSLNDDLVGIPSMEGLVSTLGDVALLSGDMNRALGHYSSNYEALAESFIGYVTLDLVKGFLATNQVQKAVEIAEEAAVVANGQSQLELARATLALGIASSAGNLEGAELLLEDAVKYFSDNLDAVYLGQAVIWLSKLHLKRGCKSKAKMLVDEHSYALRELGGSGWVLLGGVGTQTDEVRDLFVGRSRLPRLNCLGQRGLAYGHQNEALALRPTEILVLLLAFPDGLSSERLTLEMYGSQGNVVTMKATLSKLRKNLSIPISSRPYRLVEPLEADFVELMEALEEGDVERALELYRGPLLPESEAPGIVALRQHLEETLRQTVLACGDGDAVLRLAYLLHEDLEMWEEALELLPSQSTQVPLVRAHIRRIRRDWAVEA